MTHQGLSITPGFRLMQRLSIVLWFTVRIKKSILLILGLLFMSQPGIAEEKWYTPVDIGRHVDTCGVTEEKLSKTQVQEIFKKETFFKQGAFKRYERAKRQWLEDHGQAYRTKFKTDITFQLDQSGHPLSADVYAFSRSKARIYVHFIYGYSRWHQHDIVLADYLAERDPYLDEVFHLHEMEKKYAYSFKGIAHGSPMEAVEKILGPHDDEYAGQSLQYRNLYYERYNLEIVLQDGSVKYMHKGRPDWMDSGMKIKK